MGFFKIRPCGVGFEMRVGFCVSFKYGVFVKRSFDVAILGLEIGVLKLIKTVGPFKLNLKTSHKKC